MIRQICFMGVATLLLCSLSSVSIANSQYTLKGISSKVGLVHVDNYSFIKTGLSPDFRLGSLYVGLDLNLYIPLEKDYTRSSDLEWLTLRHIGFDYKKQYGFKWGQIQNLSFGHGLLMDNFDTASGGSAEFSSSKGAFLGYGKYKRLRGHILWTAQNLKGARVAYSFNQIPITPITFGATYVIDSKGIDNNSSGKRIYRDKQEGYAVDISLPIAGEFFTTYVEHAQLVNHGQGTSAGFKGHFFDAFSYRAEYRNLAKGFAPSYFNRSYYATSFDFATDALKEKEHGFLVSASARFMKGYVKAGATYERYGNKKDLLTASLGWKQLANTVGIINYTLPFQGKKNAIAEAQIRYITKRAVDVVTYIKRTYYSSSSYTESYSVGLRLNLDTFFSK